MEIKVLKNKEGKSGAKILMTTMSNLRILWKVIGKRIGKTKTADRPAQAERGYSV